jgi:hypothetical protein
MKRFISAIILVLGIVLITGMSYAQQQREFFFRKEVHGWHITGRMPLPNSKENPSCMVAREWDARIRVLLVSDLTDGELYMSVGHRFWTIKDAPGKYELRLNMMSGENVIVGEFVEYELIDPTAIMIPNLPAKEFLAALMRTSKIQLVMPGSISTLDIPTDNGADVVVGLMDCSKALKHGSNKGQDT